MKSYTIELPDDVAHILEVRAAIDDMRAEEGISLLLQKLVDIWGAA